MRERGRERQRVLSETPFAKAVSFLLNTIERGQDGMPERTVLWHELMWTALPRSLPQNTDSIAKFSAYLKATADFAVLSSSSSSAAAAMSMVLKPTPAATRQSRLTVTDFHAGGKTAPIPFTPRSGPLKTKLNSFGR